MYSSATPEVLISAQFSAAVTYWLSPDTGSNRMLRMTPLSLWLN
jgi:hypothetical protein